MEWENPLRCTAVRHDQDGHYVRQSPSDGYPQKEIEAIANQLFPATFDNTVLAMDRAGALLRKTVDPARTCKFRYEHRGNKGSPQELTPLTTPMEAIFT